MTDTLRRAFMEAAEDMAERLRSTLEEYGFRAITETPRVPPGPPVVDLMVADVFFRIYFGLSYRSRDGEAVECYRVFRGYDGTVGSSDFELALEATSPGVVALYFVGVKVRAEGKG